MIARLFGKKPKIVPSTPPDCVIWAVGDIHGRADLSNPLINAIQADLVASAATRKVLIFLGDHVDRGPDSRIVIDQIIDVTMDPAIETHCIRGNHEDRMEAFLEQPELGSGWCDYGGRDTLVSYGVTPPGDKASLEEWGVASAQLKAALPRPHLNFLQKQIYSYAVGDYFFAHAGARPGVALQAQRPEDLMWIRQAFLDHPAPFEKIIVHGHTPAEDVVSDARRIGVDTGAYATNLLSAVRLERETRAILQAEGRGLRVTLSSKPVS